MIPLLGKPLMESIVEHLRDSGVSQIVVNTRHSAPVIQDDFRDGSQFGVEIAYSFEGLLNRGKIQGAAIGSAGGMKRIQNFSGFFDDTFAVLCGDALVDVDFREAVRFHRERGAAATLILCDVSREDVYRHGVVATNRSGRITHFQEKPSVAQAVSSRINTGIYIFEPSVFDHIRSGKAFDIGGDLFPPSLPPGPRCMGGTPLPVGGHRIDSRLREGFAAGRQRRDPRIPLAWTRRRARSVCGNQRGMEPRTHHRTRAGGHGRQLFDRRWSSDRRAVGHWCGLFDRTGRSGS
jgi:hypothetical protein